MKKLLTLCGSCSVVTLLLVVGFGMFAITRLHMLHTSISRLKSERINEQWLLHQCQHDEFYHNMKHHSKLCDEISTKADDAVILHAFREVIEQTHLCGQHSCWYVFELVLEFGARQSYYMLVFAVCLVILTPTLFLPLWRRTVTPMIDSYAEQRMQQLYHTPYGVGHYTRTHPMHVTLDRMDHTEFGGVYGPHVGQLGHRKHV